MSKLLVALVALACCWPLDAGAQPRRSDDEHSYAEPQKVRVTALELDLRVDFAKKQLAGIATLALDWRDPQHRTLVLDTRDLAIAKVEAVDGAKPRPLRFTLGKRDRIFGQKLSIAVGEPHKAIRITYRTSPRASGLQWLPAKLSASGKHPYLFTQSQSIHGRSWVPLQDTPSVRFTYKARVRTPKAVVALMSANNDPNVVRDGDYSFEMPQPIPSYLMALAVGDLSFKAISDRCGVWAEAPVLDRAHAEFMDTEKMIQATEKLYGAYRWQRYDLLILPPSFPFGGMENPRLSFITPTVIVGDKSATGLIAHELAHSWSGNLVTNASWKDSWLNEGFTTYVEGRIIEQVYGKERADMENALGEMGLRERLKTLPKDEQKLRQPALPGLDPDEHTGDVAYAKGEWFLRTLETRFGRALFDPFLKKWFEQHAFQSVTTDDFAGFLQKELVAKRPAAITQAELTEWLDGEGIPKSAVPAAPKKLVAVDAAREKWQKGAAKLDALGISAWSTQEKVHFLEGLGGKLDAALLAELDRVMGLTNTQNAELAQRWYPLAIRSGHRAVRPAVAAFVERIGRRKLIMPTYRALVETPDGLAFARRIFARAKPNYHPITVSSVQALLDESAKAKRPPTKKS